MIIIDQPALGAWFVKAEEHVLAGVALTPPTVNTVFLTVVVIAFTLSETSA
jgi:hypothetical protein